MPKLDGYLLFSASDYSLSLEYVGSEKVSKRYRCQENPANTSKSTYFIILAAELVCAPELIDNKLGAISGESVYLHRYFCITR